MDPGRVAGQGGGQACLRQGLVRWALQSAVLILVLAGGLFLASWNLRWGWAWVYLGLVGGGHAITALVLVPRCPELLVERARLGGPRDLDRVLAGVMSLWGPLVTCAVAGLNERLGWPPEVSLVPRAVALAAAASGSLVTVWAMASNRFFAGLLRIQKGRGHAVATGGPYRFVRHPGYAGAILFTLAAPLVLGSLWALEPAAVTVWAIVVRAALEDRVLRQELDGYQDYARRVYYRLLPGVW